MSRELNIGKQVEPAKDSKIVTNKSNPLFEDAVKEATKIDGVGELLSKPNNLTKGIFQEGDTHYMNTEDYTKYINQKDSKSNVVFPFALDYEKARAFSQSNVEQAGNAAIRTIPNTLLEIVNQTAAILDVEDYINTDNEIGNVFSRWATEQKAKVNELAPVYRENPNEALDYKDFAYWMESGSGLVDTASAFVLIGAATGGASLLGAKAALRGLGKLTKGKEAFKFLKTIDTAGNLTAKGEKIARTAAGLSNAFLLSHAEGTGVGINVYDEVYKRELNKLEGEDLTSEEKENQAKEKAALQASSAVNVNYATFLVNMSSAFALLKTPAFTRNVVKKAGIGNSFKNILKEGSQEYIEENINMIAENQALDDRYDFRSLNKDVTSIEGLESGMLGFFGGAGQTILTNASKQFKTKKDPETGERMSDADLQNRQYAKYFDQKTKHENMSKASKYSDVTTAFDTMEKQLGLEKELIKANKEGRTEDAETLKKQLLYTQAYNAFTTGSTDSLIDFYQSVTSLSEEEAEERGLDTATYKQQATKAVSDILSLEEDYNTSQIFINSEEVYDNKVALKIYKEKQQQINTLYSKVESTFLEDVRNLSKTYKGLETVSVIDGEVNYGEVSEKGKAAIQSLESFEDLKYGLNEVEEIAVEIQNQTAFNSLITSKDYQDVLVEKVKKGRKDEKEAAQKASLETKQKAELAKSKAKEEKLRQATTTVPPVNNKPSTRPGTTPVQPIPQATAPVSKSKEVKNTFIFTDKAEEEGINKNLLIDAPAKDKLAFYDKILKDIKAKPSENLIQAETQFVLQYGKIREELVQIATEEEGNAVGQNSLNEALDTLNDNMSVSEDTAAKVRTQVDAMLIVLVEANKMGLDTKNFKELASYFESRYGKPRMAAIYYKFQAIYNASNDDKYRNIESYEELFLTNQEKANIVNNTTAIQQASTPVEMFNMFEEELTKESDARVREDFKSNGYTVNVGEEVTFVNARVLDASNKLAYLAKEYAKNFKSSKTDKFNVLNFNLSKADLDKNLNKVHDENILDFREINGGSEVTLKVVDSVDYADGTRIITSDLKGEELLQRAPIAVFYKGQQLKGVFIHLPDWITAENIRGNVPANIKKLIDIRQAVLNSPNGITTTISERTDGHDLVSKDGFVNKTISTMPDVDLVIGKDRGYVGSNGEVEAGTYESFDGRLYAKYPVNKGVTKTAPLLMESLGNYPSYVASIKLAFKSYMDNSPNDTKADKVKELTGFDIRTLEGLKDYLKLFIHLQKNLPLDTDEFRTFIEKENDKYSFIRGTNTRIDFAIGGFDTSIGSFDRAFINKLKGASRNNVIQDNLTKLEKVLNGVKLNAVYNHFGKDINIPIITENEVIANNVNYNTFIKENSFTDRYSYKLSNGNYIYTVQSSIYFDESQFSKPEILPNVEVEVDTIVNTIQEREEFDFDEDEDLGNVQFSASTEKVGLTPQQNQSINDLKSIEPAYTDYTNEQIQAFIESKIPDSKVKEVVFQGRIKGEESIGHHFHFGTKLAANQRVNDRNSNTETELEVSILNITNPTETKDWGDASAWERVVDNTKTKTDNDGLKYTNQVEDKSSISYVVFEPSQITILNSPETIAEFKEFTNIDNSFTTVNSAYTFTPEQQQAVKDSIPGSLIIDSIPFAIQEQLIDHISAEIVRRKVKNKDNDALDYIDEFIAKFTAVTSDVKNTGILDKALLSLQTATDNNREVRERNYNIVKAIVDNYDKLVLLTLDKLKNVNGLNTNNKSLDELKSDITNDFIDFEVIGDDGEIEYNNWGDGATFEENLFDKVSVKVKNNLSYIPYVDDFKFTYVNENDTISEAEFNNLDDLLKENYTKTLVAINSKGVFGLEKPVPLETLINDISAIVAYNNNQTEYVSQPNIKTFLQLLKNDIENKPYLFHVIEEIGNADKDVQNQFIKTFSRHYSDHLFGFEVTKKGKSFIFFNSSDSNSLSSLLKSKWANGLKNSNIVKASNGVLQVNKKAINEIAAYKTIVENLIENKQPHITEARILFNMLGIDFDDNVIEKLSTNGIMTSNGKKVLYGLLKDSDGFVRNYVDRLKAISGKDLEENSIYENVSTVNNFANQIGKLSSSYYVNSFKDVQGKTYFAYSQNKFLIDRFKDLKTNNKGLLEKLAQQPFSQSSFLLEQLINNKKAGSYLAYHPIDGLRTNSVGKKFKDMSPAEQQKFKFMLFKSRNTKTRKDGIYLVDLFYPTMSDKAIPYSISTLGIDFRKYIDRYGAINNEGLELLYKHLIKPEVDTILAYQTNPEKYNFQGAKEGAKQFNISSELNDMAELWTQEGEFRKLKDIDFNADLKELIKSTYLINMITNLQASRMEAYGKYGFLENTTQYFYENGKEFSETTEVVNFNVFKSKNIEIFNEKTDLPSKQELINYELNYLLGNMNMYQLFTTNPANYHAGSKDLFDNLGKRLAGDAAPGYDNTEAESEYFDIIPVNDIKLVSTHIKDYNTRLGSEVGYQAMNTTDAQEWTTLKEHLYRLEQAGDITKEERIIFIKKEKDENLDANDINKIFLAEKPVYVSNHWVEGVERRIFIKSSAYPLIQQFTKGLEIDKVRQAMVDAKIDRVVFKSALKVGGPSSYTSIYNEETGKFNDDLGELFKSNAMRGLSRKGHKKQQDLPYKSTKQTITNPTQLIALITATIKDTKGFRLPNSDTFVNGKQIEKALNEKHKELFKYKYDSLIKDLGYNVLTNEIANIDKLQSILVEEGLSRKYPLYDLEALKIENGNFVIPLWNTGISEKLEAMLNSIVDSRVRKHKARGQSYVLGSSTGYNPIILEGEESAEFIKNSTNITFDETWYRESKGVLRNMEVRNGKVQPAEIIAPFRMFDNKGNLISLADYINKETGFLDTSKIDDKILTALGFRIPTQGLNSMSYIKVVGFFPEGSQDILLAPSEWTIQMGSDFDVDKLYALMYNNYVDFKGNIKEFTQAKKDVEKVLDNEILDLHMSIMQNPNVLNQVIEPLSFGKLKPLGDEIFAYVEANFITNPKQYPLSEQYQSFKYNNAKAAAIGIGLFSNDSRFLAITSDTGVRFLTEKGKDYKFKLAGKTSTAISYPYTNGKNGKFKLDINKYYQSLVVDNENEQGMHKLNINTTTAPIIRTLIAHGFEEDVISYFINQPIIRRYTELQELSLDSATPFVDVLETLKTEYSLDSVSEEAINANYLFADISVDSMIENIKTNNPSNESQRLILNKFLNFKTRGQEMQEVQTSLNTFNAGLGKNLHYSYAKQMQLFETINNGNLANINKLIGDIVVLKAENSYISKEVVDAEIYDLANEWSTGDLSNKRKGQIIQTLIDKGFTPINNVATNIGGKIKFKDNLYLINPTTVVGSSSVYAMTFNNKLWSRYFPYADINIKAITDLYKKYTKQESTSITKNSTIDKDFFRTIKKQISTSSVNLFTGETLKEARTRLLFDRGVDNISLANIISKLKADNILNNPFINRLTYNINPVTLPSLIKYEASKEEGVNERNIYASFISMLFDTKPLGTFNGVEYTAQKIAEDLILYEIVNGGVQGSKNFLKYIPISYLKVKGHYSNTSNNVNKITRNIIEQRIQHNPREVYNRSIEGLIESKQVTITGDTNTLYNKTEAIKSKYVSVKNPKAINNFDLYKKVDEVTYKKIATLGSTDFDEYNFNLEEGIEAKSLISLNNPTLVNVVEIPTSVPEIESVKPVIIEDAYIAFVKGDMNVEEYFKLEDTTNTAESFAFILNKIVSKSKNPVHKVWAKEMLTNLDKITDYTFIINNSFNNQGLHSAKRKQIIINATKHDTTLEFEETFLEELTHAFTNKALQDSNNGVVLRLKAVQKEAFAEVKKVYEAKGLDADKMLLDMSNKVKNGQPLTEDERQIFYPFYDIDEFAGNLFKSKKLQEILNIKETNQDRTIIERILDTIVDMFNSIGFDIKRGSLLEYALTDILTLINTPKPSAEIKAELNKNSPLIRDISSIETKHRLVDDEGNKVAIDNAEEVVKFINETYDNVEAAIEDTFVNLKYKDNFSISTVSKAKPYIDNFLDRIKLLEKSINTANSNDNFIEAESLKEQLANLRKRVTEESIYAATSYKDLIAKGITDMAELSQIFDRDITVKDTLYIKKVTDFWANFTENVLTAEDRKSTSIVNAFSKIENEAKVFRDDLHDIETQMTSNLIKDYGYGTSVSEVIRNFKDINSLTRYSLNISRYGNGILDILFTTVKNANNRTIIEVEKTKKEIEDIEKETIIALKALGATKENLYEVFRQSYDKKGKKYYTGHLTKPYTKDYITNKNRLYRKVLQDGTYKDFAKYVEFLKNKTENIDLSLLFPIEGSRTEEGKIYAKELEAQVGKNKFQEYSKEQSKQINRYKKAQEAYLNILMKNNNLNTKDEVLANETTKLLYENWLRRNSPYYLSQELIEKNKLSNVASLKEFYSHTYLTTIGKKEFYDSNFTTIENNETLYKFYNYYSELDNELKQMLPEEEKRNLSYYGIPYASKVTADLFREKGLRHTGSFLQDAINKQIRIQGEGSYSDKLNPVDGIPERELKVSVTQDYKAQIKEYVLNKTVEYQDANNGTFPEPELSAEWEEDILNELVQTKSYDLAGVMKVYNLTVKSYHHKAQVEDVVKMIQNVMERQKEVVRDGKGEPVLDAESDLKYKETPDSFNNSIAAMRHFIDSYYGITKKNEMVTSKKRYTTDEKQRIKALNLSKETIQKNFDEGKLDVDTYEAQTDVIEEQINSLGGVITGSGIGDGLLKWVQLKGMGWNFMSGIANMGFGQISNYIEAAGGQTYSTTSLNKANLIVKDSILKNATFNKVETANAKKVRALMDKWGILKNPATELYENAFDIKFGKNTEFLSPYNITERTEYINQAPILVATLIEKGLWTSFDDNGNWTGDADAFNEKEFNKLKNLIDRLVTSNHGDYGAVSSLEIKKTILGRALAQFRTWLFEGVANRFEGVKYDNVLEREVKGRYVTLLEYVPKYGLSGALEILKGIIKTATFGQTFKNNKFNTITVNGTEVILPEVDAANMRKLMLEVVLYANMMIIFSLITKAIKELDDEEDKLTKFLLTTLVNQGTRLKTDIIFYANPSEFKNLSKDAIPALSLITNFTKWVDAIFKAVAGEDEITTGVYSGHSRLLKTTAAQIPLISQVYKNMNYGVQEFKKD